MILVLDLDGVVVTGHAKGGRWDQFLERDLKIRSDLLQEHFFKPHWAAIMLGQSDLFETLAQIWPQLKCDATPADFVNYWFDADSNMDANVLAITSAWRRQGRHAFLATNQEHHRARHLWDGVVLKDHFDGMIYSAALGAAKPDLLFFTRALEKLPVETPGEILFLDDMRANADAAAAAGWKARHYRSVDDLKALVGS